MESNWDYIAESLCPLAIAIDDTMPDPDNARIHSDQNKNALKASLRKYGQRRPLVVNRKTGFIEAGNLTWECAKVLGWTHIAAVYVEDDHVTAAGFAIADNRTAELAQWDMEAVSAQLDALTKDGIDIEEMGWNSEDLDALAEALDQREGNNPLDDIEFPEYDESVADDVEYITCPKCGHKWPK